MSKKYNVLVTWSMMKDYILSNKIYKKNNINFDFFCKKQSISKKLLYPIINRYDGLICGDDEIDKSIINRAAKLKVISKWGTGIDSIDLDYCKQKNIKVFNTPGAFTKSVSQYAIGLLIAFSRSLFEIDRGVRKKKWPKPQGFLMEYKTLGIFGMGKIGKRTALIANKLGFKILFYDIKKIKSKFRHVSKETLLKNSDIIIISCDLNKTSHKLIKLNDLKKMKKNSGIINIARGPIIDEKSLITALKKGYIKFAGLDVFEEEPLNDKSEFFKLKNCFLGSHNAFNTFEEVNKVNKNTLKNLIKILS
jgi:D-3-phosphoglycerate dehydrogenase